MQFSLPVELSIWRALVVCPGGLAEDRPIMAAAGTLASSLMIISPLTLRVVSPGRHLTMTSRRRRRKRIV